MFILHFWIVMFSSYFVLGKKDETCMKTDNCNNESEQLSKYSKETNDIARDQQYLKMVEAAVHNYVPCLQNCSCYSNVIDKDLSVFKKGITRAMVDSIASKGTKYQIINGQLYREVDCMFPARCLGVEHFLSSLLPNLPNVEFILNTRDWPQISKHFDSPKPVFSFSKTYDYYDILYPVWAFWEGGPAIKLYPKGLGRWDLHRASLKKAAEKWPWSKKKAVGFFRGSRTSSERDSLVLLSRERPDLVDAKYTKNQAWKSEADTLFAAPAEEVSLEDHCQYRYLFNFRGVAASFRLKHILLCRSLVFHVGDEWFEFFYPKLVPWVHYIPVKSSASKEEIKELLEFVYRNDAVAEEIAQRGYDFIWNHLRLKDVKCYWRTLLRRYAKLLKYEPHLDSSKKMLHLK